MEFFKEHAVKGKTNTEIVKVKVVGDWFEMVIYIYIYTNIYIYSGCHVKH